MLFPREIRLFDSTKLENGDLVFIFRNGFHDFGL